MMYFASSLQPAEKRSYTSIARDALIQNPIINDAEGLTNRWSQPLAALKSTFNFMKQFSMFTTLALASGGSAPSR